MTTLEEVFLNLEKESLNAQTDVENQEAIKIPTENFSKVTKGISKVGEKMKKEER